MLSANHAVLVACSPAMARRPFDAGDHAAHKGGWRRQMVRKRRIRQGLAL
jgi:hypothetical protein